MIWIAKNFEKFAKWSADQDMVGRLQMAVAATDPDYSKVLMVLVDHGDGKETVYIGLPSSELAASRPARVREALPLSDGHELRRGTHDGGDDGVVARTFSALVSLLVHLVFGLGTHGLR